MLMTSWVSQPVLRRVRRFATVALIATAAGTLSASCSPLRQSWHADYCATMPDSIGLYAGNPVTQMGYQIGKVTSITPSSTDVRVDFTVTERRSLPHDVRAIIRSPSILADRSLELIGNPDSGPQLAPGGCIPRTRTSTPKDLSEVIGSATNFINAINPNGSTNVGDVVREVDQAVHNNGVGVNQLLTTSSAVLDSPDRAIGDIGSIVNNLAQLTSVLRDISGPLKEILLDGQQTMPDVLNAVYAGSRIARTTSVFFTMLADVETHLGEVVQFTLDANSLALRKLSAHAPRLANLLNPVPWWINTAANIINNHQWQTIRYRPPLYRIRTPDGVALCNIMNASTPGSCANVQGTPYAVDVALLQYVLTEANRR